MTDIAEFDLAHAGRRVTGHGLDAWFAEARELVKLAGPLALTQLAQMAIMTTDVVMLGHFSTQALASAALGNTVFFFTWLIGCGPVAAVSPMIAHILGASAKRPRRRARRRAHGLLGRADRLEHPADRVPAAIHKTVLLLLGQRPELAAGRRPVR